jgi:hypothetical protein
MYYIYVNKFACLVPLKSLGYVAWIFIVLSASGQAEEALEFGETGGHINFGIDIFGVSKGV